MAGRERESQSLGSGALPRPLGLVAGQAVWLPALARMDLRPLLAEEVTRGILFPAFAMAFCLGVVLYFVAPDEPSVLAPVLLTLLCAAFCYRVRRRIAAFSVLLLLCGLMSGFCVPLLRAQWLASTVLSAPTQTIAVTGWLEAVEQRNASHRLTIRLTSADASLPARIRVTTRSQPTVMTGDHVALRVRLLPPPEMAMPGGYDFARDIVFGGLGATGFVVGEVKPQATEQPMSFALRLSREIDRARLAISQRIRAAIPGESGAVADALVTGRRHGVSEETNDIFRQAGVYHILSISGFHMTLVAALIFALVRGALALVPGIALIFPLKAWAAAVALVVSGAYLLISGAEVATQRSYIMIMVVLIAIMLGREAMTLRTLALAAIGVLVLAPEAMMGPSFQMSFAATLMLVAGVQHLRPRAEILSLRHEQAGRAVLFLMRGVTGLLITSIAATVATAPFSAYHFHTMHLSGVLGNVLAAPIIELATMPLEILALLLWPFGYDAPVWWLAGQTVTAFLWMSRLVADHAGSAIGIRAFSGAALALMGLGIVILAGCATRLRIVAIVPLFAGFIWAAQTRQPDLLIDSQGKSVAIRDGDEHLALVSRRATAFTLQQWLSADADKRKADDLLESPKRRCDGGGCTFPLPEGGFVAVLETGAPTADDCHEAKIIIADRAPKAQTCKALLISRDRLQQTGALALYRLPSGDYALKASHPANGQRIWMKPRPKLLPEEADRPSPEAVSLTAASEDQ